MLALENKVIDFDLLPRWQERTILPRDTWRTFLEQSMSRTSEISYWIITSKILNKSFFDPILVLIYLII